jgi:pectin lyase
VLGTSADNRVTISNHHIDGRSSWSATCDGYHYWAIYLAGSSDLITMKGNYIYHTSGRSPKVTGNTLLHAVNNYFYDNSGHAFEIDSGGNVLAEGNVFQNVKAVVEDPIGGHAFSVPSASAASACSSALGRACQVNGFGSSGTFSESSTGFLANFKRKNVASAAAYSGVAASVQKNAGYGKI